MDGWHIPCRTELGWCSPGISIESALKSVDARCIHYIHWVVVPGVCLHNKSRLLSLNSFRLWPHISVELNVKNLEESMSSYVFRILNTCSISALSLLNYSVCRPKVASLMFYGSFSRSLDSLVALLWIPFISLMSWSLNGDHTRDAYSMCGRPRAL